MLSHEELNKAWAKAARAHALAPLAGLKGPYRAIGDKTLALLDPLWEKSAPAPDIGKMLEEGKSVRLWADPHFGHDNIRAMCDRSEFACVQSMNDRIWGEVLQAGQEADLVVCLGDLALKGAIEWHRRLGAELGDRHLMVVGNHDVKGSRPEQWVQEGARASAAFSLPLDLLREWMAERGAEAMVDWAALPKRVNFGALHWPVPPLRMPSASWISVHGHIHNRPAAPLRVNCSVEAIGYRPRDFKELITPGLLMDLARRQRDPAAFADTPSRVPGDADDL